MKWAPMLGILATSMANATDLDYLSRSGWAVAGKTAVRGEFNGCENGKPVPLESGQLFVCGSYQYHYAYNPPFLFLKNVKHGGSKFIIDGQEFEGTLGN